MNLVGIMKVKDQFQTGNKKQSNNGLFMPLLLQTKVSMKTKIFFLYLFIYFTTSCDSNMYPIEVDLSSGFKPEVVISSFLNPDSAVKVLLVSNQVAFSKNVKPTAQIISSTITDIIKNQTYNLIPNIDKDKLYLTTDSFQPEKGGIYKIRIETKNPTAIIEVTDTVPDEEVKIIDLKNNPIRKETLHSCNLNFIPVQSDKVIYYELVLYKQNLHTIEPSPYHFCYIKSNDQLITREDYYPETIMLEAVDPISLLFRLNRKQSSVSINFVYDSPNGYIPGYDIWYTDDHNIKVQLRTVSRAYFKYKTSLYMQEYAAEGDLLYGMAEPVKVFGNVKGGLGVVGSYCKTDTTIWVAGRPNIYNE